MVQLYSPGVASVELHPKRPQTKTATTKTATNQTKTATVKLQNATYQNGQNKNGHIKSDVKMGSRPRIHTLSAVSHALSFLDLGKSVEASA